MQTALDLLVLFVVSSVSASILLLLAVKVNFIGFTGLCKVRDKSDLQIPVAPQRLNISHFDKASQ